ncbi:hypothetical protein AAFX19_26720 [Vibrio harveyi]|uniref:HNH endonuclease n=1 Tax=Vibrio harveyi TaxID=669 RepID=UPI0002EB6831|nr:hypothetical protein [Vibrio harveyi]HDM8144628.1 hypothetical protein [Vibrio harveyi]HDM8181420.1 hypothetical protein [Vibrio harveyi]
MIDWYLNLTEEPQISDNITSYINKLKPHKAAQWSYKSKDMNNFKDQLMEECKRIQKCRCVYCGLSFTHRLIDREHFVAKGEKRGKPEFMFNTKNLFASCAYCNRRIKGQKSVLLNYDQDYSKCEFNIIHPLLDNPNDYLSYKNDSKGRQVKIEAKPSLNNKGEETIKFFKLATVEMRKARRGYLAEIEDDEDDDDVDQPTPKSRSKAASGYKPR